MIVNLMTGSKAHRSYRALAISPDIIASVALLDPMEMDGEYACLLSLKQTVAVGLNEDGKPDLKAVFVVSGNISDLAKASGLDPEDELHNPDDF
jgi:hypothetical protein